MELNHGLSYGHAGVSLPVIVEVGVQTYVYARLCV